MGLDVLFCARTQTTPVVSFGLCLDGFREGKLPQKSSVDGVVHPQRLLAVGL